MSPDDDLLRVRLSTGAQRRGPVARLPFGRMADRRRIIDLPADQRPRERLHRVGVDALTDAELIAILLGAGRRGANAIELADRLLDLVGGLTSLASVAGSEIERVSGVGPAGAARLVATFALHRRVGQFASPQGIESSADTAAAVLPFLQHLRRERIVVAVLDHRLRLLEVVCLADGTTAHAWFPVAEVLRSVLRRGGQAFAIAHNHPEGSLEPSPADLAATQAVREASEACGVRFVEHLIVSDGSWRAI